ncbi:hypothetical protein SEVIR_1G380600v4 [Setaria viridis]
MGGGPRTFPGGLSKWQYKRMHEKLARQKQHGLLRHEKQLYLARLRSEIRASHLPGAADPAAPPGEGPTSSRSHIRALADRFRKPGAEDLWNEDDGPLRRAKGPSTGIPPGGQQQQQLDSGKPRGGANWKDWDDMAPEQPKPRMEAGARGKGPSLAAFNSKREYRTVAPFWSHWSSPSLGFFGPKRCYSVTSPCTMSWHLGVELRPLGVAGLAKAGNGREEAALALFNQERLYSVAARRFGRKWRPDSSDEDEKGTSKPKRNLRFGKFGASSEEDSEIDESGDTSTIRRRWSSAALRNCDMKKERRVLKSYEEENNDLAGRIRELREEIKNREVLGTERRRYESKGESLLTSKRFDECGISPMTVQALTDAGYVQTTVVQEAALPICLDGTIFILLSLRMFSNKKKENE